MGVGLFSYSSGTENYILLLLKESFFPKDLSVIRLWTDVSMRSLIIVCSFSYAYVLLCRE